MEEEKKSLVVEDRKAVVQDKAVYKENVEECFAHVINTIDNDEMAKALRYCSLMCHAAWESLRQALTTYKMSCLIVKIILWMKKADFDKLCDFIKNEEQVKKISELYHGYQSLPLSLEDFKKSSSEDQRRCSLINLQFIHLTHQIQTMIKNPALLLEDCKRLMASKTYATPLFSKEYLKGFNVLIDKPAVLFQAMGIFWTWSDHTILKELLHMGKHVEAVSLVDKFDQYLDSFKSVLINNFPLPILSSRMTPHATNKYTHTILAIKYKNPFDKCTWQHISKVCNSLKEIFEITRNAMQLLGLLNNDSEFTLIYLMIPTSVISMITSKITRFVYYNRLYQSSITEIAIYPKALFSTDANVKVGPLAFFMSIPPEETKAPNVLEKEPETLVSCLSRTEELPEIVQMLRTKLDDREAELIQALTELAIENERNKTDKELALKKLVDLQNAISRSKEDMVKLQDDEMEKKELLQSKESLKSHKENTEILQQDKGAIDYEQLQTDLKQSSRLIKEYEEKIQALQQEKDAVNYEQLQRDLLQSGELLAEYEEKIQILQQEKEKVELESKTSVESLNDQVSNLQSQIMIRARENQRLSETNALLTKHISTLKEKKTTKKLSIEEEQHKMLIMESTELKSKLSSLETENLRLTESNQALIEQLQSIKYEWENEIQTTDELNTEISSGSNTSTSDKMSLQQQLEESRKLAQSYQQQIEQLNSRLHASNSLFQQKLKQCEKEKNNLLKVAHHSSKSAQHSSKSAQHAQRAITIICNQRRCQQRSHSFSEPTASEPSSYDGDESSCSATSLSTAGSKSTKEPTEETRFPDQEEDDFLDNEN